MTPVGWNILLVLHVHRGVEVTFAPVQLVVASFLAGRVALESRYFDHFIMDSYTVTISDAIFVAIMKTRTDSHSRHTGLYEISYDQSTGQGDPKFR